MTREEWKRARLGIHYGMSLKRFNEMCEINPKQTQKFILEFFTSSDITKEEFEAIITAIALNMEIKANEDGRIRCHVHELDPDREDRLILDNYQRGYEVGLKDGKNIQLGQAFQAGVEYGREDERSRNRYKDHDMGR